MATRRSRHSSQIPRLVVALTLVISLPTATPVWAWGRLGHRVISRLAEQRLTPNSREAIKALLDDGETLADASTWADEQARRIRGSEPWHYVNGSARALSFSRGDKTAIELFMSGIRGLGCRNAVTFRQVAG